MSNLNTMSQAELLAFALKLAAENDALKAAPARKITLKVGEKGTVCLYHGGRYPVSLYASQWRRILPFLKSGELEAFMNANASLLATERE